MYERFSDRARKVMQLANQEALRLNHEYIGTEHIVIGIAKEGSGVGANVLKNLGVNLTEVMRRTRDRLRPGPEMIQMGKLPQTPNARKVVMRAIEAARELGHNYVGSEHLLLGLLDVPNGIAAVVLGELGVTREKVVDGIRALLNDGGTSPLSPGLPPSDEPFWQTLPAGTLHFEGKPKVVERGGGVFEVTFSVIYTPPESPSGSAAQPEPKPEPPPSGVKFREFL